MKSDRLMAITIYLLNHGKTSATALSDYFEVSTRTIMRDIDTLCMAGIPIQSTIGVTGGYEILDTYIMDRQLADKDDYSFIVTALAGLSTAYTNKKLTQTLEKMELLNKNSKMPVSMDLSVAKENQDVNDKIKLLETAILAHKIIELEYTNNKGDTNTFSVEPVRIEYKWYNWYLIAYYEKHEDYCMFKLVRTGKIVLTDKIFTREYDEEKKDRIEENNQSTIDILIKGKKKVRMKCLEYLNGSITKDYDNGDFEFCFSVPEEENFWYGVLLSMGSDIKVLEPKSLIKKILKTCKKIKNEYKEEK